MFVRCKLIAEGPGPSEVIIGIQPAEGPEEEVVLSKRQVHDNMVDVGTALLAEGNKLLIELPRESASGRWRIWVDKAQTVQPELAA